MKNLFATGKLLLIMFLLSQCTADENPGYQFISGQLGNSVFLKADQGVSFPDLRHEIEVRVTGIEDSRCPQDVNCIWGGQVDVTFTLPAGNTVTLCLGSAQDCTSSTEFAANGVTFQVILLDVLPYSATTNADAEKVVEFTVVKVN